MTGSRRFERSRAFIFNSQAIQKECLAPEDKGTTFFFETSVTTHPVTQRYFPDDLNSQQHRCDQLKYHAFFFSFCNLVS
jgi:hypothetical protein